ncbi:acyl-CoA N-acyltransferase [Mycena capillaripes]|nr:acyl-CoA N-acyltransferase [Mycena capillaripes]
MPIRTARLTLLEFTLEDIPSLYALESIPSVARYQTWPPPTQANAERVVGEIIAEAAELPRLIVEQAVDGTGTFIGRVGRRIDSAARSAEVWFRFLPSKQGCGYATEALRALIELLQEAIPPFDRLFIECDPRNDRSSKMAERVGFTLESCTEKAFEYKGEWVGSKVYSRGLDVVP